MLTYLPAELKLLLLTQAATISSRTIVSLATTSPAFYTVYKEHWHSLLFNSLITRSQPNLHPLRILTLSPPLRVVGPPPRPVHVSVIYESLRRPLPSAKVPESLPDVYLYHALRLLDAIDELVDAMIKIAIRRERFDLSRDRVACELAAISYIADTRLQKAYRNIQRFGRQEDNVAGAEMAFKEKARQQTAVWDGIFRDKHRKSAWTVFMLRMVMIWKPDSVGPLEQDECALVRDSVERIIGMEIKWDYYRYQ